MRQKVKNEMIELLNAIVDKRTETINAIVSFDDAKKSTKQIIVEKIAAITAAQIQQNMQQGNVITRALKWHKHVSETDAERKLRELTGLIAEINENAESNVPTEIMEEVQQQIAVIKKSQEQLTKGMVLEMNEQQHEHDTAHYVQTYEEQLCEAGIVSKLLEEGEYRRMVATKNYKAICAQRTHQHIHATLAQIAHAESKEMLLNEFDSFYEEQITRQTLEKLKQVTQNSA